MKNSLILTIVAAVVVAGYLYFAPKANNIAPGTTPTPAIQVSANPKTSKTPTPTPTPTPTMTVTPRPTDTVLPVSPTPGIIVEEHKLYRVDIRGFAYSPSPLTVKKGDVVVFKNFDSPTHTVTAFNLQFDSKNIPSGAEWMLATANLAPGTYEYRCTLHPSMRGTLIIQ